MNKLIFSAALMAVSTMAAAQDYKTPADLTDEQSNEMFSYVTEYNTCMMQGRLDPAIEGKSIQDAANLLMDKCETHLDDLKTFLTKNEIAEPLVEGMAKKMRSRAARHLMSGAMNNMAAQAQAAGNADKMQQEQEGAN
jgi:hypothetical protein